MREGNLTLEIAADRDLLLEEVIEGLTATPKTLPCKLFYDDRGSKLFDAICELPEYYPTRTEIEIMTRYAGEMAEGIGPNACIVEPGAGSSIKIRCLLDALDHPAAFVPTDISAEHLRQSAAEIQMDYPDLPVYPVEADYTQEWELPDNLPESERTVVFFPGSTIGNFVPDDAVAFLKQIARLIQPDGGLLIGVDVCKDKSIIEPAYNDSRGITAEFNRNILNVLNNHFGSAFDPDLFEHQARFDKARSRVDIRLISTTDHAVALDGHTIRFKKGEPILTEYSYKHRLEDFEALARRAGLQRKKVWLDDSQWFSVQHFTPIT